MDRSSTKCSMHTEARNLLTDCAACGVVADVLAQGLGTSDREACSSASLRINKPYHKEVSIWAKV